MMSLFIGGFLKFSKSDCFSTPGAVFAAIYNTWGLFYQAHPMIAHFEYNKLIVFSLFVLKNRQKPLCFEH